MILVGDRRLRVVVFPNLLKKKASFDTFLQELREEKKRQHPHHNSEGVFAMFYCLELLSMIYILNNFIMVS